MIGWVCFDYCIDRSWIRCIVCVFWVIPAVSSPMSMLITYWAWGSCWFEALSITAISVVIARTVAIIVIISVTVSFRWV